MKFVASLAVATALVVTAAGTAGAVEVRKVTEVKAAPAAVWAKVGGWCAIKDWHPAVANCQAGKKGTRTLTLKDGAKIVERITKTGKNTYSYAILESPLPVKNYVATLTAKPDSLGTTDLTWTAKFDAAGKSDQDAAAVIAGVFAGLDNTTTLKFDAAPAVPAAAKTAAAPAATPAEVAAAAAKAKEAKVAAAAARDEARLKRREERRKRYEAIKLKALEEFAQAKAVFAEKAKAAAEAAKAAYDKAKAAMQNPTVGQKT